jgi:hypothetical protein
VVAAFLSNFIVVGISNSSGLYYTEWMEHFQSSSGMTAWVGSLNIGLLCLAGKIVTNVIGILFQKLTDTSKKIRYWPPFVQTASVSPCSDPCGRLATHVASIATHVASIANHVASIANHVASIANHVASIANHVASISKIRLDKMIQPSLSKA